MIIQIQTFTNTHSSPVCAHTHFTPICISKRLNRQIFRLTNSPCALYSGQYLQGGQKYELPLKICFRRGQCFYPLLEIYQSLQLTVHRLLLTTIEEATNISTKSKEEARSLAIVARHRGLSRRFLLAAWTNVQKFFNYIPWLYSISMYCIYGSTLIYSYLQILCRNNYVIS